MRKYILTIIIFLGISSIYQTGFSQIKLKANGFPVDSVCIITPKIIIMAISMERKFTPDYEYANTVNQMVIETLKQKLGKENYIDIPLLHKDYAIISNVFESHSHNRKNKTNDVPHELIVSDCKYSVFVDINGSYGFYPRLSLRIRIINNETKKFEYDKPVQLQEFVRNEEYIKVNLIRQIKRVFNIKK